MELQYNIVVKFPAEGVLPYKGLSGMCHWMVSHFHNWIDYNGDAFSIDLLAWGDAIQIFDARTSIDKTDT